MHHKAINTPTLLGLLLAAILVFSSGCNMSFGQPTAISGSNEITPGAPAASEAPATPGEPPAQPTETTAPIVHNLNPATPPGSFESQIKDSETASVAAQKRANAGENFSVDLFERPFDQSMNTYYYNLDIKNAAVNHDDTWYYATITLMGQQPSGGLTQEYGIELDLNMDGRGDFLIMATAPAKDWSTDGVRVWQDSNKDVGGPNPIHSDAPQSGDGYETLVFDQGKGSDPDTAWARLSPKDPNSVQIAFKRSLIGDKNRFLWGAWTFLPEMFHPDWFDYNDHFTQAQAGSPLSTLTQYYPLKDFYGADNTCRWAVGFTPTGNEPGICPVPPTPTPVLPGRITGLVFYTFNADNTFNSPPDYGIAGASIRVRSGSCSSPGGAVANATTNGSGNYSVQVPAGTYCVDVSPDPTISGGWTNKSSPVSVTVANGGSATANFWYWYEITYLPVPVV